ncbi:MAG: ABC transporter substrate-binding protein [Bacillus sp. (in: Bacteria)]|nr:ABC transporter substrate-binding protein [Bacillus sp. (in: firmicutes)]
MSKRALLILFSLIISVALIFAACSSDDASSPNEADTNGQDDTIDTTEEPGDGETTVENLAGDQILLIAADQDPSGLDPHKVTAHSSIRITGKIYEGLLQFDENMELASQLAETWEQVDDVTYVFKLKEGVKFHNGREMTAEDVKYSFDRIMDPETAAIGASYFTSVESIEIINDYEVQFNMKNPDAPFLSYIAHSSAVIVPQEVVEEHGDLNQVAVGTGPFVLEEIVPDTHVKLSAHNEYHVEGQPKLAGLQYLTMIDESSRIAAIRTGQIHLTTISPESVQLLENNDTVNIISYATLDYNYLGMNVRNEHLSDERVRQAISLAVDRQELIDTVMGGEASLTGPVPPSMGNWAIDVAQHEMYEYNIEKAISLLEEAGYGDGLELEIGVPGTYRDRVADGQIIQQQLAKIGIDATIVQLEWGDYIDAWNEGRYDLLTGRNGSGTDPDRSLNFFFHTNGSANVWGFSNEEFDSLAEAGRVEVDPDQRREIYNDAQNLLLNLAPNLFLYNPNNYIVVANNVEGYEPYPHASERFHNTYLTE